MVQANKYSQVLSQTTQKTYRNNFGEKNLWKYIIYYKYSITDGTIDLLSQSFL